MSIVKPLKWADISSNNPRISIAELVRKNYQALGLRVTGGWGGGNDVFFDPDYRTRQKQLNNHRNLVQVVYGFPIADGAVDLDKQIDRFVNGVIGGFDNKIPAIDYEKYGPKPSITVSPSELRYYSLGIEKLIGPMPTWMYGGRAWWLEPPDTGDLDRFGSHMKQWVPKYRTINVLDANPMTHYLKWVAFMGWWRKFGHRDDKQRPEAAQIGIFNEAGGPLDVNMARVSKETLRKWETWKGTEPKPTSTTLPDYVQKPLVYLEKTKGGPYTPWISGHFRDGVPAWCENSAPPNPDRVANNGAFCAGMLNLACRVNGKHIFRDGYWWAGGVAWWGEHLANKGILKNYDRSRHYPPGTLFIEFYRGTALANQGHVVIQGRHGNLIQSDAFDGMPRPGINEKRTHRETYDLLRHFGGRGFEKTVTPADWLR